MTNIAILGFGVVGSGAAEVLTKNQKIIEDKISSRINIKYILDLREFPGSQFESLIIHDFNIILNDPEIEIVAEMMGGSHPAYDFSKACLEAGKSVVTSNKEVVANFGRELLDIAREHNVSYMFEASVGGGIPIIRPICNDLSSNHITAVSGILNGTTNYILTKMDSEGAEFDNVLKDAQKKGYAEANPSADVDGLDAARKIVILAALSFGKLVSPSKIHTEGIRDISTEDVSLARKMGYAIKLIGYASKSNEKIICTVTPRAVPMSNPLAGINDVFNGVLVSADMVGEVMFYGPGAGKLPTASAVSADIVDIASHKSSGIKLPVWTDAADDDLLCFDDYTCRRMFIFSYAQNKVEFKLDTLSEIFGNIERIIVEDEKVGFISDEMSEARAKQLVSECPLEFIKSYRLL